MARIELKHPGQAVADFSVNGHVITIAGLEIDCATRQQDSAVILEIRQQDGIVFEGNHGAYLAHIAIPAKVYEDIPSSGDEGDEEHADGGERVAQALDANAVTI